MKRIVRIVFLSLALFYLVGAAVLGFSSHKPNQAPLTEEPWEHCQKTHQQIEDLTEKLKILERTIDQHYDMLIMLQKIMVFIEETNPRVPKEDIAQISNIAYQEARRYNLDPLLIISIIYQESRFQKHAVGAANEIGLMQVMPTTAAKMASQMNWSNYNLYDIEDNIRLGTRYLIYCLNRTTEYTDNSHRNIEYGLSAYNRGLGAVLRDLKAGRDPKNRYQEEVLHVHTRIIEEHF